MKTVTIQTINPRMAADMLANVGRQRHLNKGHVAYLADEMTNGWNLNGEAIKLDRDGNVLDGQHRLHACVVSGVPFMSYVIEGLDPDAFDTIDTGRPRSGGDTLGSRGIKNRNTVASACRWGIALRNGTVPRGRLANRDLWQWYEENPLIAEITDKWSSNKPRIKPVGALAAMEYLLGQRFGTKASAFFYGLRTGENLSHGSPIVLLRNRLLAEAPRGGRGQYKDSTGSRVALIAQAFNHHLADRKITRLFVQSTPNEVIGGYANWFRPLNGGAMQDPGEYPVGVRL